MGGRTRLHLQFILNTLELTLSDHLDRKSGRQFLYLTFPQEGLADTWGTPGLAGLEGCIGRIPWLTLK